MQQLADLPPIIEEIGTVEPNEFFMMRIEDRDWLCTKQDIQEGDRVFYEKYINRGEGYVTHLAPKSGYMMIMFNDLTYGSASLGEVFKIITEIPDNGKV